MRIGAKLTVTLIVPLVLLMALFGYVDDIRTRSRLHQELVREGRSVARTVQVAMEDYFRDRDLAEARDLVDKITAYERVFGLRVFDREGLLVYQSQTLEAHPFIGSDALREVLTDLNPVETERRIGREPLISFLVPLIGPDGRAVGAVQLLQLGSFIEEEVRASRRAMVLLTAVMILAVGLIITVLAWFNVTRPSRELARRFLEVGSGDLTSRVPVRGQDELGNLAREFNALCDRLEEARRSLLSEQEERRRVEADLRRAERLASLGRFAAGLAHQIGTPLNVISGRAEAMKRDARGDPEATRKLQIIVEQIARITRTVRDMLNFASQRPPKPAPGDPVQVLRGILEFIEDSFRARGIRLETDLPEGPVAAVFDSDQISEVFLNLAKNAGEAMPDGGTLRVIAAETDGPSCATSRSPRCLRIVFEDTGTGIAPENLARVFDPFFTTKDVGEGTGLGLSVTYGILQEHGGAIDVESRPGEGARVSIFLPLGAPDGTEGEKT